MLPRNLLSIILLVDKNIIIVHDVSCSSKTVLEPTEVVGPMNELFQLELPLEREEAWIWRDLTLQVMEEQINIEWSVAALAQLDLLNARQMVE